MVEPCGEVVEHLVVIAEVRAEAETMASRGIDVQGTLVASPAHGRIVGDTVGDWRHSLVVVGHQDNGRRRLMDTHGVLVGIAAHKFTVSLVAA